MINVHNIRQSFVKKLIKIFFDKFGFEIKRKNNWYDRHRDSVIEINKKIEKIISKSSKLINASLPNQWGIIQSLQHIKKNKVNRW